MRGESGAGATKELVRRFYTTLWNAWETSLTEEILLPNFRFRGSIGLELEGRDSFWEYVRMFRAAFPDFHNRIDVLVAEGNSAAARLTYSGTHQGEFLGHPPTRKHIVYTGAAFFETDGAFIASAWVLGDVVSLYRQLETGRLPTAAPDQGSFTTGGQAHSR